MIKVLGAKFNNIVLVKLFLIAVVLISLLYVYFLNNTIRAVVSEKKYSEEVQVLSQECQKLESQYFGLLGKIDIDYAHQLGFVDQAQKADYIVRQAVVAYGKGF